MIDKVRDFWEENPLWTGESSFEKGTKYFFEEHRKIYIQDCFAGNFDIRFLPSPRVNGQNMQILDLGCGIGFWVTELGLRGYNNLFAVDLTKNAIELTRKRLEIFSVNANLGVENAEEMSFPNHVFDHVNCQGVIHHTPDTLKAIAEISRVLKKGGTASISVYYRNRILKVWPYIRWIGWLLTKVGARLKGRGREKIFLEKDIDEIVRLYDGIKNPIGKSFSKKDFVKMLNKHFIVEELYLHFFPARAFPFRIPKLLHRWLDKKLGFMVYATVRNI